MPRESHLLNEFLVRKRDRGRLSQHVFAPLLFDSCVTLTSSSNFVGCYFKFWRKKTGVDFVSVGLLAQGSVPQKSESRQVLALIIENGKLAPSTEPPAVEEMAHFPAKWNYEAFKKSLKRSCLHQELLEIIHQFGLYSWVVIVRFA